MGTQESDDCLAKCVKLTRFFYNAEERSDAHLQAQLDMAREWLDQHVSVPLTEGQVSALLCLVSDVSHGLADTPTQRPLRESFLINVLNREMYQLAAAEFYEFCYVHGRLDIRAWQKRRAEHCLFTRGLMLF